MQIQRDNILKKLRRTLPSPQFSALARLLLILAILVVSVQGRTYYVSFKHGADTNAGAVSAPWKTIARVNAQRFQPGDVVAFKRGETWQDTLRPRSSGIAKLPIIFRAYGVGPPPTFNGTTDPGKDINIDNNEQSYIVYREMNLQGARQGLRVYAWRAHVRGIILENSVISTEASEPRGTMSAGVYASVGSGTISNIVIRDSEFHPHPTGSESWGVYFVEGVVGFRIERNFFTPAGEDAICVWHSAKGVIARNRGGHNGENTIDVKDSDDIAITENSAESDGEYNIVVHTVDPSSRTRRMVVSESFFVVSGRIFVPVGSVSAIGTMRGPMFTSFNNSLPFRTALFSRSMSSSLEMMCGVRNRNSSLVSSLRVVLPNRSGPMSGMRLNPGMPDTSRER